VAWFGLWERALTDAEVDRVLASAAAPAAAGLGDAGYAALRAGDAAAAAAEAAAYAAKADERRAEAAKQAAAEAAEAAAREAVREAARAAEREKADAAAAARAAEKEAERAEKAAAKEAKDAAKQEARAMKTREAQVALALKREAAAKAKALKQAAKAKAENVHEAAGAQWTEDALVYVRMPLLVLRAPTFYYYPPTSPASPRLLSPQVLHGSLGRHVVGVRRVHEGPAHGFGDRVYGRAARGRQVRTCATATAAAGLRYCCARHDCNPAGVPPLLLHYYHDYYHELTHSPRSLTRWRSKGTACTLT